MIKFDDVFLYIGYLLSFKELLNLCKPIYHKVAAQFKTKYCDIGEIYPLVKSGELNTGDFVETNGYLLEYAQIFKPYSSIHTIFNRATKKDDFNKGNRHVRSFNLTFSMFQPPVQKIPGTGELNCYFLYDTRFKGFKHEKAKDSNNLLISEYAKPILLICDKSVPSSVINKEIKVKAKVIKVKDEIKDFFKYVNDDVISQLCSNFVDLYSDGFEYICLYVENDNKTFIKDPDTIDILNELDVPIFLESQLNDIEYQNQDEIKQIVERIIPNRIQLIDPKFPATVATSTDNVGIPFLSTDQYSFILRDNIIGIYTEANIFNNTLIRRQLKQFKKTYVDFKLKYRSETRKIYNKSGNIDLNFIYNYDKQYLFDQKGVLSNYNHDESVESWLRDR